MAEIRDGSKKTKVIAFYLPQYHSIPENDKAWGKGFTEWTNVKKSYPYFKGHYQPRVPLNQNYYNLLDPGVQEWQSSLAQEYDVFGFCYYHYWFKDGKMLLQKPAENMLHNSKIKEPFCFCWANENWSKTWTGNDKELIISQDYGGLEDWKAHIAYLIKFFRDDRYITIDGKPVLIIYKPELIPNIKKMIEVFRTEVKREGLPGIVIMFQFPTYYLTHKEETGLYDYYIDFEPAFTTYSIDDNSSSYKLKEFIVKVLEDRRVKKLKEIFNKPHHYNYDNVWTEILRRKLPNDKFLVGGFTDWDNSPRKKRSVVFDGARPEKFGVYFKKLTQKAKDEAKLNVVFINAWNEWGEGAYLEPDERYKYGYLRELKNAIRITE